MTEPEKLKRARALWQANHFEESCRLFSEAAGPPSASAEALTDAARALGHRYQIKRAESLLSRLATLPGAGDPGRPLALAQTYRMIHREEKAISLLEASLKSRSLQSSTAFLELAVLLERRHRADEADQALDGALKLSPNMAEALVMQARLRRIRGEPEAAGSLLTRVTRQDQAHPFTKAQAWAALAALSDAASDFPEAVRRMEQSKNLLRPHAALAERHSRTVLGHFGKFGHSLTCADFQRWQNQIPETPARVAQLTGFPRSGTTLLENILDAHPGLTSSEEREVLSRDILNLLWMEPDAPKPPDVAAFDAIAPAKLRRLRAAYLEAMEEAAGVSLDGRLHLDKNPTHTVFIPAIIRLFPETKFLMALRDPRDVIVSCYFQYLPLNPSSVSYLSWESTALRYQFDFGLWKQWRGMIHPDSWLEVRYEDVVSDMENQARRALTFLGLPWESSVAAYRQRLTGKTVHSPTYIDVAKPIHARSVGRWKNYLPWLEPQLDKLRPFLELFGY